MIFAAAIYGNDACNSRKKAIEEGSLIDVTEAAKVVGFKLPVAITQTVWGRYIEWIFKNENRKTAQEKIIRLKGMLKTIYLECSRNPWVSSLIYSFYIYENDTSKVSNQINLKIVIGADDRGESVMTIMMPYEDD